MFGLGHVYLGAEHLAAVRIDAGLHLAEEFQVLLDAAVAVGALGARLAYSAAAETDLFLTLVVYIGEAFLDELLGPFIKLVEVVRCIEFIGPVEAQPVDVFLDGLHVFGVFLDGIGVVETEVGGAAVFLCQTEIEADALCMADVQVTVGLRRESRLDRFVFAFSKVLLYDFFQKVQIFTGICTVFHFSSSHVE